MFVASTVERHSINMGLAKFCFYLNYVIASLFISYFLLPRFFYPKKYLQFTVGVILILLAVIFVEECLLEQIFYPDSRGAQFSSIIRTLLQVLPLILILTGFKFAWDAQQKQSELERLNRVVAESRLQFLKSQINPHFLFNNLNNLYAHALESSPKTPKIILELSSLLRYMLYDCREQLVPLDKELKSLMDFIQLQELQIEDRGTVELNISGSTQNQLIAPLILIVFVENCFKHSTSSQSDKIEIKINISIEKNQLSMHCSNTFNAKGNTQQLTKGIGLENVQSRLELLYPNTHKLIVEQTDNLFTVYLTLELSTHSSY